MKQHEYATLMIFHGFLFFFYFLLLFTFLFLFPYYSYSFQHQTIAQQKPFFFWFSPQQAQQAQNMYLQEHYAFSFCDFIYTAASLEKPYCYVHPGFVFHPGDSFSYFLRIPQNEVFPGALFALHQDFSSVADASQSSHLSYQFQIAEQAPTFIFSTLNIPHDLPKGEYQLAITINLINSQEKNHSQLSYYPIHLQRQVIIQ